MLKTRYNNLLRLSFVLLVLLMGNKLQAQDDVPSISYSSSPRTYTIADIEVNGIDNYEPQILINLSGLAVGQKITVPGDEITEAVKKYWNHGLFSDVKIFATKTEGSKIWLEIQLQARPRLSKINYYGLKPSEEKDVEEKVAMMNGTQVTPFLITRAEKYITEFFVDKGFYNTEVRIVQKDDPEKENNVILDITVDKKEKVKVSELEFTGNSALSYNELNRAMKKTNEKGKIKNFFRTKKFIEEQYKEDLTSVVNKYNEEGFRDMVILTDSVIKNDDNTVDVHINIEEGNKYYIGNITWIGNSIYPSDYLSYNLRMRKGDVFNQTLLDERLFSDDDAVHNLYMDNGYLFSNIQPAEIKIYGDTIDLEMRVYEGKQATISNIGIFGNDKTHEHVVRREIRTKPGELFSKSELMRTVRELAQLQYFNPETISPDVQPNMDDGTVDINYHLEEKPNDQIEVSGGWGSGMFVGTLGLTFSNFSMRNIFNGEAWKPLPTGDGQTLSLRAQMSGQYYRTFSASFTEPWLGGKRPNSLSVSAYHSEQSGVSDSYSYNPYSYYNSYGSYGSSYNYSSYYDEDAIDMHFKVTGLSVGFGKRLTWPDDWFSTYYQVSYERYDIKNWNYVTFNNGVSNSLSFSFNISRNSLDNPLYTRSGSNISFGVEFTPPWSAFIDKDYENLYNTKINATSGSDEYDEAGEALYQLNEFHKWKLSGSIFTPLDKGRKLVVMGRYEMGFLGSYNKYVKTPFGRFDVGGDGMSGYSSYSVENIGLRGYANGSVTPVVLEGNSFDQQGNIYNKLTLELRYPITLDPSAQIYVLSFLEAGNAWADFDTYSPFDLKRSAGVGVRIYLPIFGMMGIDWGYGFDDIYQPEGYSSSVSDVNGSQFHFVIGQQF